MAIFTPEVFIIEYVHATPTVPILYSIHKGILQHTHTDESTYISTHMYHNAGCLLTVVCVCLQSILAVRPFAQHADAP